MRYHPLDDNDWGMNPHPACPGGCGELADECACRARRAERDESRFAQEARRMIEDAEDALALAADADLGVAPTCRWRGCTWEAEIGGLCDAHYGTL